MTERDLLNDLFAEAQAKPVAPSPEFMARVLADAAAHQPQPAPIVRPVVPAVARPVGLVARLMAALGGAAAVAGVSSAAMAGLVLGYVQPEPLMTLADSYGLATASTASLDLMTGYDSLLSVESSE
ncbi:dihydroorotate dehydrogenase [Pseudotabrizicola sp. L79]|uniref:dihydroorotate dehydrogenase n=1 Tax=Pseudotabrizicola sp. L79 TaxID=3118402 RepID=UPI002F938919